MRNLTEVLGERNLLSPFPTRDISFVPELGIVMTFISKSASSYLKTYVSCLAQGKPFSKPRLNPHMPANTGFLTVEHLGHRRMSDLLTDPDVPKVVVGREPISRLLSAFSSRVVTWQRETYDSNNRFEWFLLRQSVLGIAGNAHAIPPMTAISEEIGWEQLVDYVTNTPAGELDRHLVPQAFFAGMDLISYDLVGKVERLDRFLDDLCRLTGREPLTGEHSRINESRSSSKSLAAATVTTAHKEALYARYLSDYEYFGYPRP